MNATDITEYQPLTLKTRKDGVKIGQVLRSHVNEAGVAHYAAHDVVVSRIGTGSYYQVRVRINGQGGFKTAGLLRRDGRYWNLRSYGADSQPRPDHLGYGESGTMAVNAERIVHEFLGAVEYAEAEAAKTPEQKAAEEQARREQAQKWQQERLVTEAKGMLDLLDKLVPETTAHYAVEDVRKALATLIRKADTIKTRG